MQGVCRHCWAARLGTSKRKYIFTPSLRTELRIAYTLRKKARAAAIMALARKTRWPRHIFTVEAQRLGIVTSHRRPWTVDEDRVLELTLGESSVREIAQRLQRTHESVKARAERLEMSIRIRSGYCIADLAIILGVPRYRVHEWIEKGLFGTPTETPGSGIRVTDEAVTNFIRNKAALIDFRLADQTFLEGVLCG